MPRATPEESHSRKMAWQRARRKELYHGDPEYKAKVAKTNRAAHERRCERNREIISQAKAGGCVACGETDQVCLDMHHLDPGEKEFLVSRAQAMSEERLRAEIAKCVPLCVNCHRKFHAGKLSL